MTRLAQRLTFRRRIALLATGAVAVAIALAAIAAYAIVRAELRAQIDDSLHERAMRAAPVVRALRFQLRLPPAREAALGGPSGYAQIVQRDGRVLLPPGASVQLPVDASELAQLRAGGKATLDDVEVDGRRLRVLSRALPNGSVLQIARPLDEVDDVLGRLRLILAVVTLGGIALAFGLGLLVARAALAPVARLTASVEHVGATRDLEHRIALAAGGDELARLARSFNAMLDALQESMRRLDDSVATQRRLVADASHELRTPVAALRTNIEVLRDAPSLAAPERERLLDDVEAQADELGALIADVIELARGEQDVAPPMEDVRLDELVEERLARARRHAQGIELRSELEPTLVYGAADRLARAVDNLLANAIKWSPPNGGVDVQLADATLTVRDRGPGIPAADLPHVFDRFHRGQNARATPGSGLGLAIVRQVAALHHGTIVAETPADGGTCMRLDLRGAARELEPAA